MAGEVIFYPVFMLALLSALVMLSVGYTRLRAHRSGAILADFLERGELLQAPAPVVKTTHNLQNLFEFPLLFYIVILFVITYGRVDEIYVWLSWSYVLLRYLHSYIHITYNKVSHRFSIFACSNLILIGIWFRVLSQLGMYGNS
jgi:hypothetical protein